MAEQPLLGVRPLTRPDVSIGTTTAKVLEALDQERQSLALIPQRAAREGLDEIAEMISKTSAEVEEMSAAFLQDVGRYRESVLDEKWDQRRATVVKEYVAIATQLDVLTKKIAAGEAKAISNVCSAGPDFALTESRDREVRDRLRQMDPSEARAAVLDSLRTGDDATLRAVLNRPPRSLDGVGIDDAFDERLRQRIIEQRGGPDSETGRSAHYLTAAQRALRRLLDVGLERS